MTIKVVLVDDHTMVRSGVKALLEGSPGIQVIGEASDGREAVKLAGKLNPDVVVLDVAMPKLNGIEAARQIKRNQPTCHVVMLSMHEDRQYIFEALRAGAGGYVLKDAAFSELVNALRTVTGGQTYLSPAVAGTVLEDYVNRARGDIAGNELEKLSGREREVLQLIAEGKSSPEIAKALHISIHTVDTHRRNIMEKLDVHNLAGLIKFAVRHGLSSLE
jgi:DNA-binding NarL/FixJ family response regulator